MHIILYPIASKDSVGVSIDKLTFAPSVSILQFTKIYVSVLVVPEMTLGIDPILRSLSNYFLMLFKPEFEVMGA